jgi:hypothetical protein
MKQLETSPTVTRAVPTITRSSQGHLKPLKIKDLQKFRDLRLQDLEPTDLRVISDIWIL